MSSITSLGVSRPVALDYLVQEDFLPPNPTPNQYGWETFDESSTGLGLEEVITTSTCAVWSQGGVVRRVFRLDPQDQVILQATLTWFPSETRIKKPHAAFSSPECDVRRPRPEDSGENDRAILRNQNDHFRQEKEAGRARALVVLLAKQIHVHFIDGSNHIVQLPFEFARIFPTSRGLLLQRNSKTEIPSVPSPLQPSVPQNSFFSPHMRSPISASVRQNPDSASKSLRFSLGARHDPRSLDDFVFSHGTYDESDLPRLFTMTDPLSPIGLVVEALPDSHFTASMKSKSTSDLETAAMSSDEEVLYVSRSNEATTHRCQTQASNERDLLLAFSYNHTAKTYGVWYCSYQQPKSAAVWRRQREEQQMEAANRKARVRTPEALGIDPRASRRSGARDSLGRSFQGRKSFQPSHNGEVTVPDGLQIKKTRRTEVNIESNAQLESPEKAKAVNRRTSSMLARTGLVSQESVASDWAKTTHPAKGGLPRRGPSFGPLPTGRRSFRLSQVSARSSFLGAPDLDIDVSMDDGLLLEHSDEHLLKVTGYEGLYDMELQDPFDDTKRELMMTKVATINAVPGAQWLARYCDTSIPQPSARLKIITLDSAKQDPRGGLFSLLIHNPVLGILSSIRLRKQRIQPQDRLESLVVLVSNDVHIQTADHIVDIEKISDGTVDAILVLKEASHGREILIYDSCNGALEGKAAVGLGGFDASRGETLEMKSASSSILHGIDVKHEFVPLVMSNIKGFAASGPHGTIDLVGTHASHRVQVKLQPKDDYITRILAVCDIVLSTMLTSSEPILATWWSVSQTVCVRDTEWNSLAVTLLTLFVPFLDARKLSTHEEDKPINHKISLRECSLKAQRFLQQHYEKSGVNTAQLATLPKLLSAFQLLREEELLNISSDERTSSVHETLGPLLAQMGHYLNWEGWGYTSEWYASAYKGDSNDVVFDQASLQYPSLEKVSSRPTSFQQWLLSTCKENTSPFLSLSMILKESGTHSMKQIEELTSHLLPRSRALSTYMLDSRRRLHQAKLVADLLAACSNKERLLETLPEYVAVLLRSDISAFRDNVPATVAGSAMELELLGTQNAASLEKVVDISPDVQALIPKNTAHISGNTIAEVCEVHPPDIARDNERGNDLLRMIFRQDTMYAEAQKILHSHIHPIAVIQNKPGVSESHFLEAERAYAQLIGIRSTAVTTGTALLGLHQYRPLPTQELEISLWETQVRMMPSGHIMTLSRENFTEPKSAWAAYHTGVAAGLQIERNIGTIDSSWISLNKPSEPHNRHAGLLLGLGLNGYLKTMPKWLVFKYLTPKHEMTSVSLLIGLSASHLGTMNTLCIKVLSIHLVSLLPPGAAELNISSLVQTAGTMGVGLLYYNTHHRRMSEVLLTELEHIEKEDPYDPPARFVRDEGYRLAAGFALGLVNLAHGSDMRALQDLRVEERLLALATGPKDVGVVDVADQASAGAIMALTLIFMKTNNKSLARKIDAPSAKLQFDYVRPDMMLLRIAAKSLILWDDIQATEEWIYQNLPADIRDSYAGSKDDKNLSSLLTNQWLGHGVRRTRLRSTNLHTYNIVAGLCWSISLKFAGTGDLKARDLILRYYDGINSLNEHPLSYDEHLAGATLLRLQHLILLGVATVMSGTGDLQVFRRARILHGTVNEHSTFGLHQAAHMVIGALFLGQGRFSFSTSNLSIASLLIAFYPLFPKEVMDNKAHLQAFRHFWVLAAEPRCVFPRDIQTKAVVIMPIEVELKNGLKRTLEAPALLHPSLKAISKIRTLSGEHSPVTIDFADPQQLAAFRENQTIWLQKRSVTAQYKDDKYDIALALERTQFSHLKEIQSSEGSLMTKIFHLDLFRSIGLTRADLESIFPRAIPNGAHEQSRRRESDEPLAKAKLQRAERKKAIESELLRAMPMLAQFYAPVRKDENAMPSAEPAEAAAKNGEDVPLDSLLDIRTTKVDDVLSLWGSVRDKGRKDELNVLFETDEADRSGWIGSETVDALRAEVVGERLGLDRRLEDFLKDLDLSSGFASDDDTVMDVDV